jgi:hypothetical protein
MVCGGYLPGGQRVDFINRSIRNGSIPGNSSVFGFTVIIPAQIGICPDRRAEAPMTEKIYRGIGRHKPFRAPICDIHIFSLK